MGLTTRYFVVEPRQTYRHKSILMPDDDILLIADLQTTVVATLEDGRKIIHAVLTKDTIQAMGNAIEAEDPLTLVGVEELGITTRYAGATMEEVLINFPELAVKKVTIDEDGNEVLSDKFTTNTFLGQEVN